MGNNNNEILKNAINKKELISFKLLNSDWSEKNVEVIYIDNDDVENKEFKIKTNKGEVYTYFSNNVQIF